MILPCPACSCWPELSVTGACWSLSRLVDKSHLTRHFRMCCFTFSFMLRDEIDFMSNAGLVVTISSISVSIQTLAAQTWSSATCKELSPHFPVPIVGVSFRKCRGFQVDTICIILVMSDVCPVFYSAIHSVNLFVVVFLEHFILIFVWCMNTIDKMCTQSK